MSGNKAVITVFEEFPNYERLRRDQFATRTVGIEPVSCEPGQGRARLVIGQRHLNGIGITQGGAVFTLADFALAICVSSDPSRPAVLIESNISYLNASREGDTLTAIAIETSRTRKLISVETTITDQNGKPIARFAGRAYTMEPR